LKIDGGKNMKATVAMMVMVMVIVMMTTGCAATEDNVPVSLSETAYDVSSKLLNQKIEMKDDAFWESADKAETLLENTLEKGVEMTVSFQLTDSEGTVIPMDDFASFRLYYINDVWRQKTAKGLIYALSISDEVIKAHGAGKSIEITGTIFKWKQPSGLFEFDNKEKIISVCDLGNDGAWDYVIHGKMFFANTDAVSLQGSDGEALGIGVVSITPATLRPLEEQPTKLRDLYEIAHS
jgi:hypothetical protein